MRSITGFKKSAGRAARKPVTGKTGVRVFHDYLREKHRQRDEFETLLELETRYCRQEPFISMARYIHVTARKPENQG